MALFQHVTAPWADQLLSLHPSCMSGEVLKAPFMLFYLTSAAVLWRKRVFRSFHTLRQVAPGGQVICRRPHRPGLEPGSP